MISPSIRIQVPWASYISSEFFFFIGDSSTQLSILYIFLKLAVIKSRCDIVGKTISWMVLYSSIWRRDYIIDSIMFFHKLVVTLHDVASTDLNQLLSGCTSYSNLPLFFISCNNSVKGNFAHSHPLPFCHPVIQFILEV